MYEIKNGWITMRITEYLGMIEFSSILSLTIKKVQTTTKVQDFQ